MAICFYGLTRSLQYTYDSIRGNLIQPIIDEGYEVRRPLLPMLCSCAYEFPLLADESTRCPSSAVCGLMCRTLRAAAGEGGTDIG